MTRVTGVPSKVLLDSFDKTLLGGSARAERMPLDRRPCSCLVKMVWLMQKQKEIGEALGLDWQSSHAMRNINHNRLQNLNGLVYLQTILHPNRYQ